jgi:hypothetical protein
MSALRRRPRSSCGGAGWREWPLMSCIGSSLRVASGYLCCLTGHSLFLPTLPATIWPLEAGLRSTSLTGWAYACAIPCMIWWWGCMQRPSLASSRTWLPSCCRFSTSKVRPNSSLRSGQPASTVSVSRLLRIPRWRPATRSSPGTLSGAGLAYRLFQQRQLMRPSQPCITSSPSRSGAACSASSPHQPACPHRLPPGGLCMRVPVLPNGPLPAGSSPPGPPGSLPGVAPLPAITSVEFSGPGHCHLY